MLLPAETQQKVDAQLKELGYHYSVEPGRLHSSVRVANNGDRQHNTVDNAHLAHHIYYNTVMRFGQALFIDGRFIYRGYLDQARCDAIQEEFREHPPQIRSVPTIPYS